ncbi:MAG: membrane protein insertase YidC, partial [Acidobacteria bacterium]|nr:membrane protein insertase YidC [Acidobacteriota bacterium]
MDTKRLIFAVVLSIVVIMVYQHFFMPKPSQVPQTQPGQVESTGTTETTETTENKGTTGTTGRATEAEAGSTRDIGKLFSKNINKDTAEEKLLEPVKEDIKEAAVKEVVIETDLFTAVFTNQGAGLKSFVLKKYRDDKNLSLDLVSEKVAKFGVYPFYFSPFEGNELFMDLNSQKFVYEG